MLTPRPVPPCTASPRERPAAPIYGLTSNEHTYHWLALSWGTEAFLLKEDYHDKSRKDLMVYTDKVLKDAGKVADGRQDRHPELCSGRSPAGPH